jgi:hypothetical protein
MKTSHCQALLLVLDEFARKVPPREYSFLEPRVGVIATDNRIVASGHKEGNTGNTCTCFYLGEFPMYAREQGPYASARCKTEKHCLPSRFIRTERPTGFSMGSIALRQPEFKDARQLQ